MDRDARTAPRFARLAAGLLVFGAFAARSIPARADLAAAPADPAAARAALEATQADEAATRAGQGAAPNAGALAVERARLRAELDRVNAEIDAYKRGGGVGDDYRLRARLADAESLARRLMEIDARLGLRSGAAGPGSGPLPAPFASPTDAPADLDAKADILADQVRRLRAQADSYGARARQTKARQDLRRRAGELERDPFGPIEASKRHVASGTGVAPAANAADTRGPTVGTGPQSPAMGGGGLGPATSISSPGGAGPGGVTGPPAGPSPTTGGQETALSVQLHDLLDTATLADIRRLEGRAPAGSPQALERAAAALRARALELDTRARAMRAQAHAQH